MNQDMNEDPEIVEKTEVKEPSEPMDIVDFHPQLPDIDEVPDINDLVPTMDMNVPTETKPCIVSDDMILDVYKEVLDDIRDDRKEIDTLLANFVDMVMNNGDSTSASKEALVKLVELKIGAADKKAKIADLMTRIKLKDPDTYKPYLNAHQTNNISIESPRRGLISKIKKKMKGE